ncbi:hypothetical protein GIB67_034977 [Kingdonia uniflora]|uniref:Retrotransposon Copia-like N-terminal domain-containing protein n=1 Tax=Kingdonia uniflora TaxID=39325 RepID=A0A7J7NGW4_9MAGN|nr:hypothetical protein GIB67_034977 [Kingdonia uniflora]
MVHMVSVKLEANNFLLWRNQFIPLFTCKNLMGYVNGSFPPPEPMIVSDNNQVFKNPAYKTRQHTYQLLLSLIYLSLSEETMSKVLTITRSVNVCDALEEVYSHKLKSREIHLKDELQFIKKGSQSVSDYAKTFKTICNQLAFMGHSIYDTEKFHWLLCGLGPKFHAFYARISIYTGTT